MAKGKGEEYPSLRQLLSDLERMDDKGLFERGAARVKGGGKLTFTRGLAISRFSWPGVGDYWLDRAQQEVVALLLEAYFECSVPDVQQYTLLRAAGSHAVRLADLFVGHPAWGTLIVAGRACGSYRLAAPVEISPLDDDEGEVIGEVDEWVE